MNLPLASLIAGMCLILAAPLSAQERKPRATLTGHTKEVVSLVFSPDGKTLASGSGDNSIKLWDVATGRNTATLKDEAPYHWRSLAFSPDGKTLASGGLYNKLKLWDVGTRKRTILLDNNSQSLAPLVVFSPDGKTLASGGRCISCITLSDVAAGTETANLEGYGLAGVRAMTFTPNSKILVAIGYRGEIKLWDVATGKNTATLKIAESVLSAAFSPDGKTLATASHDNIVEEGGRNVVKDTGRVVLWEVATGKELTTLQGHTAMVSAVVFSPNGKTLATGSADKTIKLWDVATGKELATLKGHRSTLQSMTFSLDGTMLASGSIDKTINLWVLHAVKIDLTGSFKPGKFFTVNACITYPPFAESLTLELPPGLERVEGKEIQPVPPADDDGNCLVQWKVRVLRPGQFQVRVCSSTGETYAKIIEALP